MDRFSSESLLDRTQHRIWSFWRSIRPAQLFVGSFLALILLGTVGFKVLPGLYTGPPLNWVDALFTATSAVCVTGLIVVDTAEYFTTWGLANFQSNLPLLCVVMVLIVLGGIGFLTLEEFNLWRRKRQKEDRFRLSLHSQIVLGTTALLIVGGWVAFTAFEWHNTLAGMPLAERLVNGLFASITPRTAGFNTIDYAEATSGTNFLTIIFMMIGGSPGSTAGGIKTTTFALLGLLAWSRLRGRKTTNISSRTIPEPTMQKSMSLFVVAFGIVTTGIFLFSLLEVPGAGGGSAFLTYMFEVVSAFNTVGLSMGATGDLSDAGRLITVVLMFIGRVGILTFVAAMAREPKRIKGGFRYAYEDVSIG